MLSRGAGEWWRVLELGRLSSSFAYLAHVQKFSNSLAQVFVILVLLADFLINPPLLDLAPCVGLRRKEAGRTFHF